MKKQLLIAASLLALAACQPKEESTETAPQPQQMTPEEQVQRGLYLVTIGGCNDCHSPKMMTDMGPEPDTARLLSGHPQDEPLPPIPAGDGWIKMNMGLTAFVGPWGASFSANLTPDETGTGNWTYEQFETAIRNGKSKGLEANRGLLPPMPWQMIRNLTDEDLRAVFAYLRTLKPIHNIVPQPISPDKLQVAAK
jgi:mono/diheme cytochrome c family protein